MRLCKGLGWGYIILRCLYRYPSRIFKAYILGSKDIKKGHYHHIYFWALRYSISTSSLVSGYRSNTLTYTSLIPTGLIVLMLIPSFKTKDSDWFATYCHSLVLILILISIKTRIGNIFCQNTPPPHPPQTQPCLILPKLSTF